MARGLRVFIAALGGLIGLALGIEWVPLLADFNLALDTRGSLAFIGVFTVVGFVALYLLAPAIGEAVVQLMKWMETRLFRIPASDIAWGVLGIIFGLIVAILLSPALAKIPAVGNYLPAAVSLLLGYLGWAVAVRKREDWIQVLPLGRLRDGVRNAAAATTEPAADATSPKVLDTSVIIDGRIADLCKTGFLEGALVVPQVVLDELRHIADSSEALRRNRGRRGLDVLNELQTDLGMTVVIDERQIKGAEEVDIKLLLLAKELGGKVLTNDFNLSKVAQVHGVEVLNINELANALKPVVLPGEEMMVQVLREGKEAGQGVGFLDDGTMIVVDGGKRHLGTTIGVEVTSVLQTNAGRMIFAKAPQLAAQAH